MPDFAVVQRGTDTSGRPIFATRYMWSWWDDVVAELGFTPTIVQGAFMGRAGGGAAASAGYHDGGGCFDLRTWDLTAAAVERVIRVTRSMGAASWVRDQRHGMDPHLHFVLGSDQPLNDGAAWQWQQYLNGGDGLASGGRDYQWRPNPLVTIPPEDPMADYAAQLDRIEANQRKILDRLGKTAAIRSTLATLRQNDRIEGRQLDKVLEQLAALEAADA